MLCIVVYSLLVFVLAVPTKSIPPNTYLDSIQQVEYYDYPVEIHEVTTEDGYILELHRIPNGLNNTKSDNKKVALFVPGLFCPSGVYFIYGSEKSLPFILANLDYDVWVMNWRGSTYSRKHVSLDPDVDKEQFFDFSWHEIGAYDLPASMDYILNVTGQSDLFYIGHSMGTTTYFPMVATKPEYFEKIRLSVLLAPVGYMGNVPHPLYHVASDLKYILQAAVYSVGIHEVLKKTELSTLVAPLCGDESPLQIVCSGFVSFLSGVDFEQFNASLMPLLLSVAPGGGSVKQLMHYGQSVTSGKFREYDYGVLGNLAKYGQFSPPDYDLGSITSPVALYYASNDYFSAVIDVQQLASELPNLAKLYLVPNDYFNHVDFLFAKDLDELVYNDVVKLLTEY